MAGQAYCINGVHYDPSGNIESDQPHSIAAESEPEEVDQWGDNPAASFRDDDK